jgi:hypothetical protein
VVKNLLWTEVVFGKVRKRKKLNNGPDNGPDYISSSDRAGGATAWRAC